jgi:hypothetical protein
MILVSGCAETIATPDFQPTVPAPKPGTTTVVGRLVFATTGLPYTNNYTALAEIHRNDSGDAIYALDTRTSPQTYTDQDGYFMFRDIPAGEYAFVVGDPMVDAIVLNDLSTGHTRIWKPEADHVLNLGVLKFEFLAKK